MRLIERASEAIAAPVFPRSRLLTALAGLTLAVTLLIARSAMARGATEHLTDLERAFGENVVVVRTTRGAPLTLSLATELSQRVPEVTDILGVTEQNAAAIRPGRGSARVLLVGADERLPRLKGWQMAEGRSLTADDITQGRKVAVIGQAAARSLFPVKDGKVDARIGADILVNGMPLTVVGVFSQTSPEAKGGLSDVDDCIVIPVSTSLSLNRTEQLSLLAARARDRKDLAVAVGHLQQALDAQGRGAYTLTTFRDELSANYAATDLFARALSGTAAVAFTLGLAGLWLMLRATVNDRSAEISIRLAAGATRGRILLEFLSEGALLGLVAGSVGAILGLAATLAIRSYVGWPIGIGLGTVPGCVLLALAGGTLAGLEPAVKASRVDTAALWE